MSVLAPYQHFVLQDSTNKVVKRGIPAPNSALDPWIFPLSTLTENRRQTLDLSQSNLMDLQKYLRSRKAPVPPITRMSLQRLVLFLSFRQIRPRRLLHPIDHPLSLPFVRQIPLNSCRRT